MKHKLLCLFTTLYLLVLSAPSYAATWTNWTTVDIIYPYSNGTLMVRLDGEHKDANGNNINRGCTGTSYFAILPSIVAYDQIYSLLLAAQHSGSEVRLFLDGCSGANNTGYPYIKHAQGK